MKRANKQSDNRKNWLIVTVFFGSMFAILISTFVVRQLRRFHIEDHWNDEVIAVTSLQGEERNSYSLSEFGYYILVMERDIQQTANIYDSEDPTSYWNIYIGDEQQGNAYVRVLSKQYAINFAKRDLLYELQMKKEGFSVTEEKKQEIEAKISELKSCFTNEQFQRVGMSQESFEEMARRVENIQAYMTELTIRGVAVENLETDGTYYEELLASYEISENNEIFSQLVFGSISVN